MSMSYRQTQECSPSILAQGMRRSWSCVIAQGMHLGLVGLSKASRLAEDQTQPPSTRSGLVWSSAQGCLSTPSDTKM